MKRSSHMPDVFYTGELPPLKKLVLNVSNIIAWFNGDIKRTGAMKQSMKEAYDGKRTEDVKYYDTYAQDHYHKIARKLMEDIHNNIRGKDILDVGCGSGILTLKLLTNGAKKVMCVDISENMLKTLKDKILSLGYDPDLIEAKIADAENLPFKDNSFDAVVSSMVFGLVPNQDKMLQEMVRVAKPGGVIAMSTHGPKHYLEFTIPVIDLLPKRSVLGHKFIYWPRGCKQMVKFCQDADLTEIIVEQSIWEDRYKSGSELIDFVTSSTGNFWAASIPDKQLPAILNRIRNYFQEHDINKLTLDVIYVYGKKK